MWADEKGLFRRMWAKEAWERRAPGSEDCWLWTQQGHAQSADAYFDDTWRGAHCANNWYAGNPGIKQPPPVTADAPALFGFDHTIDQFCGDRPKDNNGFEHGNAHANNCIRSNLNILSLYDGNYNICRNLEWMMCAAQGALPGQRTPTILFSFAPRDLSTHGPDASSSIPLYLQSRAFGQCGGFREAHHGPCDPVHDGYATDDIFFLETCLFHQLCTNGADLFTLRVGEPFYCTLNEARFRDLETWLRAPLPPPPPRCDSWCNAWTCAQMQCTGCSMTMFAKHGCGNATLAALLVPPPRPPPSPPNPPPSPPSAVPHRARHHEHHTKVHGGSQ